MAGIKETKELMVGVNEVGIFLLSIFKDGLQLKDFGALWDKLTNDEEFKKVLEAAYDNYEKIPEEASDLDVFEIIELSKMQADYVAKVVEEIKKK